MKRSESSFREAAETRLRRQAGRGSRVGELKLFDELAAQGPYRDSRHGNSMDSGTAAGILRLKREIRAADATANLKPSSAAATRRMRKGSTR